MIPRTEFGKIFTYLAAAYPKYEYDDMTIAVYYDILGDLDVNLLKSAVQQFAGESGPWFPSAGQLRNAAFDLMDDGSSEPSPGDAWEEVTTAIHTVGYIGIPEFSHPKIAEAVRHMGGWRQMCWADVDNRMSDRKWFMECYRAAIVRQKREDRMLPQVKSAVAELMAKTTKQLTAKGERDVEG